MIARYHSARGPLFESQEAYLLRTPQAATAAAAGRAEMVKNTPEYHPNKPSPESKGLQKDETSSLITSQNSIPLSKELSTSISRNITEEERNITSADKDSSFNISDIVNYTTDENLSHTPLHRQLPSIQKRSAEGLLTHSIISPDSNTENTPSRTDNNSPYSENLRNKLRRIAVEDGKENRPPSTKVTPQDGVGKMTGRIVSSTPAVPNTNKQAFLTPTSCLAQSLNKKEDSILHNRAPLTQVQRFKKSLHSRTTLQHVSPAHHLIPPADCDSYTITKGRSGFSVSSMFSSIGDNSPMTDVSSSGPVSQEQLTPNIIEPVHTPSQIHPLNTNIGGGVSNEQMVILQNQITEHFKGLEKTLLSETRWLKNEIVRQAVDTQFALEDILNNVQERQNTMNQRLVNMDQNISTIMRNM
ncbi:uncharacterized protein LOC134818429 [Bolinopsis microptera]|uniref:uncharacterized protein LOC134818429 n=1 Tax=Bolinopsis microptera TaxID=2820187 RepID=UPI003078C0BA